MHAKTTSQVDRLFRSINPFIEVDTFVPVSAGGWKSWVHMWWGFQWCPKTLSVLALLASRPTSKLPSMWNDSVFCVRYAEHKSLVNDLSRFIEICWDVALIICGHCNLKAFLIFENVSTVIDKPNAFWLQKGPGQKYIYIIYHGSTVVLKL